MKRIRLTLPSPYVGLRPFFEREALLFFGRDPHVRDLLAKLARRQRFLAVLGASGTGKSSLVRAGLIPALHRGALPPRDPAAPEASAIDRWNSCIFTPGDAPLAQLAHALTADERWRDGADRSQAEASLAALLGASPLALSTLYRQKAALFDREALLLVVDQFEEIFRYRQRNPDEADSFVKLLLRSASEDVPIYVVMTMRSDFLGNAVQIHGLAEAINSGIYLTPRLGIEEIRSVIASPLQLVGGSIDPVLANRLVNTLGAEDELPVLAHALLRMWDRAKADGRSSIEAADYAAICGPRDGAGAPALPLAIDNHASEIFDALPPPQQAVARQLFLALVERREGRDVRRPLAFGDLRALVGDDAQQALVAVIDAYRAPGVGFVLPPAGRALADADLIDISHESLIRRWRQLQAWLADEAQDVTELRDWKQRAEQQRAGGGWLDENDFVRATQWQARVIARGRPAAWAERHAGRGAYELVERYLQDSQAQIERRRADQDTLRQEAEEARIRRFEVEAQMQRDAAERAVADKAQAEQATQIAQANTQRVRQRGNIAMLVGALAVVASVVAWVFYGQAQENLSKARLLTDKAQAGELAHTAESLGTDLPDTSVLLALEARRLDPESALANALIRSAEASYPFRLVLRGVAKLTVAVFSPNDRSVLTAGHDPNAHLWNAADGQATGMLNGHTKPLRSAEFSSDSKTVLTTSEDQTARLWDAASTKALWVLGTADLLISRARLSPDGAIVLTASPDGMLRLWNVADGKIRHELRGHMGLVNDLQFSTDSRTVLSAGSDKTARRWNVVDGQQLPVLSGHSYALFTARFSHDGSKIFTASGDRTAILWDAATGSRLRLTGDGSDDVKSAKFSRDGLTLLTHGSGAQARLWEVASGKLLRVLTGHEGQLRSAVFSPGGESVLTAGADKVVRLWDAASGDELRTLRGHENGVLNAVFSSDGQTVLSTGDDGTARLWAVADPALLHVLSGHAEPVVKAVFSPDGKKVLTAGGDPNRGKAFEAATVNSDLTARLWDAASDKTLRTLAGHDGEVTVAEFTADGQRVLTASRNYSARLWSVADGSVVQTFQGHQGNIVGAQFSPDGQSLLTASEDMTARLWDLATGQERRGAFTGHEGKVSSAQFSSDGRRILTASWDNTARLWDVASGKTLITFKGHTDPVLSASFLHPDDKLVLTASWDKTARLWNADGSQPLLRGLLSGHTDQLTSAVFSKDGKLALTASDDRTARLWEVASGRYLRTMSGHEGPLTSAEFSPDSQTVLTASTDNTARLWDTASGKLLRTLRDHGDTVTVARFSADGIRLLTASADATARLWRCQECQPVKDLAAKAKQRVGRPLTPDERKRYAVPEVAGASE